jgi:hypothetical protein
MFKTLNQTLKTLKILSKIQIKQGIKPDEKIIFWTKKYFVINPNPSSSLRTSILIQSQYYLYPFLFISFGASLFFTFQANTI